MSFPQLRFSFPKRRRLVYLGETGQLLLRTYIKEDDYTIYRTIRTECNIWVALYSLFTGRWSARGYYQSFLELARPEVVITFEDNALEFYLTKALLPSCKTLAIQNGRRDTYSTQPDSSIWQLIREATYTDSGPDVVATHGEPWSKYFRGALGHATTKVVSVGSVKNNSLSIGKRVPIPRLLFVSSFPNLGAEGELENELSTVLGYWQGTQVTFGDFYQFEGVLARKCAEIARTRGFQFGVLGKRPSWQKGEYSYFASSLDGFEWFYLASDTEATSYEAVAENDLVVSIDSTFGYEMFARSLRVAFVSARMQYAGLDHIRDCEFGYPLVTQPTGPFWTNQATDQEITRVINYVIDTNNYEWDLASRHLQETVMPFDFGNSQLCRLLATLGIETHGPGRWGADNIPKN
jgi:surface carbohydrate biosynthesis protein